MNETDFKFMLPQFKCKMGLNNCACEQDSLMWVKVFWVKHLLGRYQNEGHYSNLNPSILNTNLPTPQILTNKV